MKKEMFDANQLRGWATQDSVDFFKSNRWSYEDLYESERHYITRGLCESLSSVLDVGCAAGGFCSIFKSLNQEIHYTGVDVTEESIRHAREQFEAAPSVDFWLYEGKSLEDIEEIQDKKFDMVFCSGLLHLIDNWPNILAGMVERAKQYVIADFRICLDRPSYRGEFLFDFDGDGRSQYSTNYHVINLNDLLLHLDELGRIATVDLFGYKGNASSMARGVEDVYMVFLKMGIGQRRSKSIAILEIPDALRSHVSEPFMDVAKRD